MIARLLSLTLLASLLAPVARTDDLDNIIFRGTVRDSASAVIPAARVTARHLATGVERSSFTDDEGRYRLLVTEPGVYRLKVTAEGFREEESRELTVALGRSVSLDFALTPAGVSEQVTIESSAAPLIDTTRTVTGDTINRKEIDELPILNRNALQLVFLLAGVTEAPLSTADLADEGKGVFLRNAPEEAGIFSLTGAPATSNNLTIDGLDNNDDRAARERILLNPEAIAEVQIITNQYAAEYGRASGGRINLRTRSGTSDTRGDAYFYFGDESLNANTFSRNARGLGRVPQQERREGAVVSGPIRKKKDFFLASYERLDVTDSDEIIAFVPVAANPLFPLPKPNRPVDAGSEVGLLFESVSTPESRNIFNLRADFNFTDRHNATVRFDAARGENRRGFPGGARLLDTLLIEGRNSDSVSLTDNFMISTRLINQARFQYSRLLPRNSAASNSVGVIINDPRVIAGAFTGSESSPAFSRAERRAQFQDNLLLLAGAHQIKGGIDAQLVRSVFTDLFATGGQYTFDTVADFLSNNPSRFVQRFDTVSRRSNDVLGVFAQDDWRIRPHLTFSFGLRWDSESILDDRDNFSPRLAIAWDPFGASRRQEGLAQAGKTVVRAGFGIFYNRALLRTIDDFSLGATTVILDSRITPDLLDATRFPHPVTDRSLIARFGLSEQEFLRRIDRNLEIPYTIQTGLGIEREITKRLAVSMDYIFTRGAHLWRESNINAPVLPEGFSDFTEFLLSRDFDNRPDKSGRRPVTSTNADVVRFDLGANSSSTAGAVRIENGIRILTLGLNAPRSTNIAAALNAVRHLRPDPSLTQVELLESTGNSFYHGGAFTVRYSFGSRAYVRGVYTLSKFIDEGTTNTASPQDLGNRRAERALSLQDQRHRFTVSGSFREPFLEIELAPIISIGSSKPFNIGAGFDRNLNDIENDRPDFIRPLGRPVWRRPGSAEAAGVRDALRLAPIGSSGNLPRNYGRGPGTLNVSLRAARTFAVREHIRIRPAIDVFNVFNQTVFSFGSEFIDRDDGDFLTPRRAQRPRSVQLSLKVSF
jgi:hypothetical protein